MPKMNMPEDVQPQAPAQPEAQGETMAELEAKLAKLTKEALKLQDQLQEASKPTVADSTALPADRLASQSTEDEVARAEVIRDPFDTRNALKILRDPPGKKLRWISISYREMRSMKGWNVIRYDDAIGRELHRYVAEPPQRMIGSAQTDDCVRRGDVILCWIDKGIWQKRQNDRVRKSQLRIGAHKTKSQNPIGQFAATTDAGLTEDANPFQETRTARGFVSPKRLEDYRKAAHGTVNDPAIKTPGRNMFEEASDEE